MTPPRAEHPRTPSTAQLRSTLEANLTEEARTWLTEALTTAQNSSATTTAEYPTPTQHPTETPPVQRTTPPTPRHAVAPPDPVHDMAPPIPDEGVTPPTPGHAVAPPNPGQGTAPPATGHHVAPPLPGEGVAPPVPGHGAQPANPSQTTALPGREQHAGMPAPAHPATPPASAHPAAPPAPSPGSAPPPPPSGRRRTPLWELRFAEAGRHCRAGTTPSPSPLPAPATTSAPGTPVHATPDPGLTSDAHPGPAPDLADTARVLLLHAAHADLATVQRLYSGGSAAERRAVLLALPHLDQLRDGSALALVEDALRANDTRLVAAAVGPYAAAHLPPHAWRHAVLKCLFTGVPVTAVTSLADRSRGDTELARMLTDYAAERTAAGRPVPADLDRVLTLTTPAEES
jgi:hypothetical protein